MQASFGLSGIKKVCHRQSPSRRGDRCYPGQSGGTCAAPYSPLVWLFKRALLEKTSASASTFSKLVCKNRLGWVSWLRTLLPRNRFTVGPLLKAGTCIPILLHTDAKKFEQNRPRSPKIRPYWGRMIALISTWRQHLCDVMWCRVKMGIVKRKPNREPSTRTSVTLPAQVYSSLEIIAKQKKVSMAWVIRDAAERYVTTLFAGGRLRGFTPSTLSYSSFFRIC